MGVKIRFSEDVKEYVVPRLAEDQIDDLFYQEDEIGEMRHTAFMIECGLEEDPPDGPDVPPVPWGDALLAQQQAGSLSDSSADSKAFSSHSPVSSPVRRAPPPRSRSTDDIELVQEELSPKTPPTRRRLVAANSGSLHAMKISPKRIKIPPQRCNSSDNVGDTDLSLVFAKTDKASPRNSKRFMRCKSGTTRGLAAAAAAAMKNIEDMEKDTAPMKPLTNQSRKLTRAKSGSPHGMGAAAEAARKALAEMEESDTLPRSPVRRLVVSKSGTLHGMRKAAATSKEVDADLPNRNVSVRKLVAAKSGTLHGMRRVNSDASARPPRPESPRTTAITSSSEDSRWESQPSGKREVDRVIFKNGKKTTIYKDSLPSSPLKDEELPPRAPIRRTYSTSGSESGSSDLVSDLASDDDNASNISISTNGSEGRSSPLKPYERSLAEKKKKVKVIVKKEKSKESTVSPKKKKSGEKSTLNGSALSTMKVRNGLTSSTLVGKKIKTTSVGNLDIPPAFRYR
jgi:hypothetical protein